MSNNIFNSGEHFVSSLERRIYSNVCTTYISNILIGWATCTLCILGFVVVFKSPAILIFSRA